MARGFTLERTIAPFSTFDSVAIPIENNTFNAGNMLELLIFLFRFL